ncbi:hypothetical protein SLS56_002220 [Neofusicoccum ribis]|uniref:Ankyrin repeat protein n=1 Tax=Neofusicoccum ribis TaxID=45134 RepID=A0ABR3T4V7_9PEZI
MANTVLPPSSSDRVTRQNGEATFAQPVEIGTSAALSPASNGQATFSQPVAVHGVSHSSKPSRPPHSSHFRLTELPLELFARVIMWVAQSAYSCPIQEVVDLRLVSKLFDSEVIHAICGLKPINTCPGGHSSLNRLLLPRRLLRRVITDKVFSNSNNEGGAIRAIREVTDALYVASVRPEEHFKHHTMTHLVHLCVQWCRSRRCLSEITGRNDKTLHLTADEDFIRSCMVAAACLGSIELFDQFRMRTKGYVNMRTNFLGTPGWAALIYDQLDMAAHLLTLGAVLDGRWLCELFLHACKKGQEEVVQLVLDNNVNLGKFYTTGFERAARYGHITVADKINQTRNFSQHALAQIMLHSCSKPNREPIIRYLYQMGIRSGSDWPEGLIRTAIKFRQAQNLQVLLDLGEDPNQELSGGSTIHFAATSGDVEVTRVLVSHGARPPDDKRTQRTLMRGAIKEQNVDMVNLLAEFGIEKPGYFDKMASKWAEDAMAG